MVHFLPILQCTEVVEGIYVRVTGLRLMKIICFVRVGIRARMYVSV
jgi:hypothetical protein